MSNTTESHSWQVIVPVYNEANNLGKILEMTLSLGYTNKITFVNDGSTDGSAKILDEWKGLSDFKVIHLSENRKKEGAIREVMERQISSGQLPQYTILLDADSFILPPLKKCICDTIEDATRHMEKHKISGMAFRIDAAIPRGWSFIPRCVYADYAGSQIDNFLTARGGQLWVINGPGGIFQTNELLSALRKITPDFETGDLMITVALMSSWQRVGFWPTIAVKTFVPNTYYGYFKQRRRWERGTVKTMWNEIEFYKSLFAMRRLLAVYVVQYFLFAAGILTLPIAIWVTDDPQMYLVKAVGYSYIFWVFLSALKCSLNVWVRRDGMILQSIGWSFLNGFLFLFATGPARIVGFCDAVKYIFANDRHSIASSATHQYSVVNLQKSELRHLTE